MQFFPQHQRTLAAFSLGKKLVTLTLGTIALAALAHLLLGQPRLEESQETTRELMQNARVALEVLTRELRMSGYNPTGAPFDGLLVTPTALHIKADLNGDGDTDDTDEDIRYTYDAVSQQIVRMHRQHRDVLADHVQHFTVTGLDRAGQPVTASTDIRQLRLTVQTGVSQASPRFFGQNAPQTSRLTTRINVRNFAAVTDHGRG